MTPIRRCSGTLAVLITLALAGAAPALGATHTWIGPVGGVWSNAANWSGGVPTSGELGGTIVQFGANTTSTMDIAGLVVDQIHFTGANNTIAGTRALSINGSTLTQNIVSDAGGNTLDGRLPITLVGVAVEVVSKAGTLTLAGPTGGADSLLLIGSGGGFSLNGGSTGGNTYSGATTLLSGTLHIATPLGVVIDGSSLTIGNGSGPGARLVLDQASDISSLTDVTVNSDGVIDFNGFSDFARSLTVNGGSVVRAVLHMTGALALHDGTVSIGTGNLAAGSLNMTGGTISGPGVLALSGNAQAASSSTGPATVASGLRLDASPTVTVATGAAPELRVTGAISETGGSQGITKAGTGTLLTSGANTYTGTTTVSAGTLVTDGGQTGPFSVGQNGTLTGSGAVGATTVAGILAPAAPGLHTGALSFGPTGRLDVTLGSVAPAAVPSVFVAGAAAIDPSAVLNLVVSPGIAVPHGSEPLLIDNDGSDAIGGHFAGIPTGFGLATPEGVPLTASYSGGNGNDLGLTAGNVQPQVGSVSATPDSVVAGKTVALSVAASDANRDPLTTTWNFGDGTTGSGAATSHTYATAGRYTAVATVSDGLAQVQSTAAITVAARPANAPPPPTTTTVTSSSYGAVFGATVPHACVHRGAAFTATLSAVKKTKAKGKVLLKVTKVVFSIGKSRKTDRSAPFRVRLAIPRSAAAGSRLKLRAKAYLVLHGGKRPTKTITTTLKNLLIHALDQQIPPGVRRPLPGADRRGRRGLRSARGTGASGSP